MSWGHAQGTVPGPPVLSACILLERGEVGGRDEEEGMVGRGNAVRALLTGRTS